MVRKQVYIEPQQDVMLKRLAREGGMTEAGIVRQAIDLYGKGLLFRRDLRAWDEERKFIQQLIQRGPAPAGRHWCREELYE